MEGDPARASRSLRVLLEAARDAPAAVPARGSATGSRSRSRVLVVVYALIPQSALGGAAAPHTVALALRHDVVPVGAYFLGRSLLLRRDDLAPARVDAARRRRPPSPRSASSTSTRSRSAGGGRTASSTTSTSTSATTTTAPAAPGVAGLPENFIYNVGGDKPFLRRLVSTFLSPLASSYLFVVALLVAAAALRASRSCSRGARGSPACCGRSRARRSLALAAGLVVLAVLARRRPLGGLARASSSRSRSAGRTSSRSIAPTGNVDEARPTCTSSEPREAARRRGRTTAARARASRRCTSTGRR